MSALLTPAPSQGHGSGEANAIAQDGLSHRLVVLREIAGLGQERLDEPLLDQISMVVDRAGQRMCLAAGHTVVALAGSTGSGKSSLFNALIGQPVAAVGVRRPTTATASAAVWGQLDVASPLLDWLAVPTRYQVQQGDQGGREELAGLVLLDLPDHDSQALAHRLEVDRLVGLVDLLIWVVDPQKYADNALHSTYLRPLATHDAVTVVVLNHIDTLPGDQARECLTDLSRLVHADGLPAATVLGVSARTGAGLAALRAHVHDALVRGQAMAERISADIDQVAATLADQVPPGGFAPTRVSRSQGEVLVGQLCLAAGAPALSAAVEQSYRHQARLRTGWPVLRWLRHLRPDPLRRWLTSPASQEPSPANTSEGPAPLAGSAARSRVELAVRQLVDGHTQKAPAWQRQALVRRLGLDPSAPASAGGATIPEVMVALQHAVGNTPRTLPRHPRWWTLLNAAQWLLFAVLLVGLGWLSADFVLAWFHLPALPSVKRGPVPLPTLLVVVGVLAAWLLALLGRVLTRWGARRAARRTARQLRAQVSTAAETHLLAPLRTDLQTSARLIRRIREVARG